MAELFPTIKSEQAHAGGRFREADTLERLAISLPEAYTLFHNIDWAVSREQTDLHGEVDIIVMNRAGDLLLVEVKAGGVEFRESGIYKQYGGGERQVDKQAKYQYSCVRARLHQVGLAVDVKNCLVLPDCRIGTQETVGMPRDRIVDATQFDQLGTFIQSVLPPGTPTEKSERVKAFLLNELDVVKDFSILNGQVRLSNKRLSGGLATWVSRIGAPSGTLVVSATAGSGKTLLASQLLRNAADEAKKALYVCFNRSLADSMVKLAPVQSNVATFHELSIQSYERSVGDLDFSQPDIFQRAEQHYIDELKTAEPRFDVLVLDEAQDFELEWVEALSGALKDTGMLYLLQDHDQRLYDRPVFDCTDAVVVESRENFRSPRSVVNTINLFGLTQKPVQARSSYFGEQPEIILYDSEKSLFSQTAGAISRYLEKGFKPDEIVVLSLRGLSHSRLAKPAIGKHTIAYFTGRFDASRNPVWSDGDIVFDSVYRFKGQSAPAVVISEIDFEQLGEPERRKLFVAMTRAEIELTMVMSERAEACLSSVFRGS